MLVLLFACEAAGASSIRHSLRPRFVEGAKRCEKFQQSSGAWRGEIAELRLQFQLSSPDSTGRSSTPRLDRWRLSGILGRPVEPGDDTT